MRATAWPYQTMTVDAICDLPVADFADAEGAHLFLWVTAGFNREGTGVKVARAWGFEPLNEIVWAKPNYGLGRFPRPQHEILLVCRRGDPPAFKLRNEGSIQSWALPRLRNNGGRAHSAKPDGALDLIEAASEGPYLELFARRDRMGWDTWGDESLQTVELPASATDDGASTDPSRATTRSAPIPQPTGVDDGD
jgi:N6-adenosine-specific RNA methylase IME4